MIMKWKGGRKSSNVDDRRATTGGRGEGMPMQTMMIIWPLIKPLLKTKVGWAIIALGIVAYMSGFNPLSLIGVDGTSAASIDQAQDDKNAAFISTVLASTEDVWNKELPGYREPVMVLYRSGTQSGCGFANSAVGPFYCPADQKVYLDLGFFNELAQQHDAPGDFAQAYVLAHEVGHHIQNLQGTLSKVQQAKQQWGNSKRSNALQVRVELQADCYAGAWAYYAHKRFHIIEEGDIEEALRAASAIGDDTLQRKSTGTVRPDAFTHGTSEQRVEWFLRGFRTGDVRECNTF
jgi:hypothetical protein